MCLYTAIYLDSTTLKTTILNIRSHTHIHLCNNNILGPKDTYMMHIANYEAIHTQGQVLEKSIVKWHISRSCYWLIVACNSLP